MLEISPADAERLGSRRRRVVVLERDSLARRVSRSASACGPAAVPDRGHRGGERERAAAGRAGGGRRRRGANEPPIADVGFVEATWILIVKSLVIFAVIFAIVPVLTVVERKVLGRFQHRYGPNRIGPFGLMQPLADVVKLLGKEAYTPENAVPRSGRSGRCSSSSPASRRSRSCRSGTSRTGSASTGSTSRSGSSTSSPSARSRSTACCSAAGPRARSTASSARCARRRS